MSAEHVSSSPLLAVRGLAFSRDETPIFGPLDFSVDANEALLVQGGNGAGKTTLLRVLAGLLRADAGEVELWPLLRTDTVTLVNLVSETRAVPEFLGSRCQPGPMAQALQDALENRAKRGAQLDAMDLTMDRLGKGGEAPGLRAARSVLQAITGPR